MWFLKKPKPDLVPAEISGIRVRSSTRARRMALRVDARRGDIVLTFPKGASLKKAEKFIAENKEWILEQRAKSRPVQRIDHGTELSVSGKVCRIDHRPGRGITRLEEDRIIVHGQPEHISRRVRDFLKKEAGVLLEELVGKKVKQAGLGPVSFRVIDPKTRWGSCSPDGKLMFSWRLILAPPFVLDYVVAHEVAHLVHLDHSRKFWDLCFRLADNGLQGRRWLKKNGFLLQAYK